MDNETDANKYRPESVTLALWRQDPDTEEWEKLEETDPIDTGLSHGSHQTYEWKLDKESEKYPLYKDPHVDSLTKYQYAIVQNSKDAFGDDEYSASNAIPKYGTEYHDKTYQKIPEASDVMYSVDITNTLVLNDITVTKRISTADLNFANGNPTFGILLTDEQGTQDARYITFTEDDMVDGAYI